MASIQLCRHLHKRHKRANINSFISCQQLKLFSLIALLFCGCYKGAVTISSESITLHKDCAKNTDCEIQLSCFEDTGRCIDSQCIFYPLEIGTACEDNNLCTFNDICTQTGVCQGEPILCKDPLSPFCLDENTYITYKTQGQCEQEDGNCIYEAITHDCENCIDECLGLCDDLHCEDKSGGCLINGYCTPEDPLTCQYEFMPDDSVCQLVDSEGVCNQGDCVKN